MHTDDISVTKIPKRVLSKDPKGLKPRCKALKVGQALPVKTLGWAINLKSQLNEATENQYEYWTEPQISAHKYRQMSESQKKINQSFYREDCVMKTNVNLTRKLNDFEVTQRTKDGMFNATSLLSQWNKSSGQKKQMVHYTDNESTQEFISALLEDQNSKQRNSVLLQSRGKTVGLGCTLTYSLILQCGLTRLSNYR